MKQIYYLVVLQVRNLRSFGWLVCLESHTAAIRVSGGLGSYLEALEENPLPGSVRWYADPVYCVRRAGLPIPPHPHVCPGCQLELFSIPYAPVSLLCCFLHLQPSSGASDLSHASVTLTSAGAALLSLVEKVLCF